MRVRTGDGGRLRWLGHAVIIASLLLATALGHDEFNCITLSKTTWHRPDNRGEVFVGQTSWVQFDVSLLDRDPVTGNNCRWMKKLEVVLEVDASGMGGTVVPYPVTSLEEVSVEQDVQDHASEGVSWDTFELWREGMGFSTKTMYRSLFFITGMPGARPGTHALQVKLKATVGDEDWIDREEYCRIGQRHTACTGRCASDATCLASCEDQRSRDEQECLLAISGITTEWRNVSQGMPLPLEFEIKLPYQVKLDPKSKNQYVGGSSKLSLTVTNTGVEALEDPRLVLEIADGDREYLRLEDEAIELGQSILPGQSVENVPAGIRISRDAWVQDTNSQPITYRIGTRLDFTSGLTRQEPGIPLEYTKDTTLVLQTRDVPRLVFTVLDPQTGQAMDLRKDAITLTPLANATLVIDIRNTQPGYAHDCLGKLSLSAGVLHIVNASHLLSAGNRTKLGEEHYFELGDFDIDVRKELRIEGMAKFTNEGEYEASFGVVNCRDATRRVHAVKAETIKLLVGPVPLAIDQGIIAQKQTYAEGALVEFYLGAVNPTQVPFERCVLTVTRTPDLKYVGSDLRRNQGGSTQEDRFEFPLGPSSDRSFDYMAKMLQPGPDTGITMVTTCRSERYGTLVAEPMSVQLTRDAGSNATMTEGGTVMTLTTRNLALALFLLLVLAVLCLAILVIRKRKRQRKAAGGEEEVLAEDEVSPMQRAYSVLVRAPPPELRETSENGAEEVEESGPATTELLSAPGLGVVPAPGTVEMIDARLAALFPLDVSDDTGTGAAEPATGPPPSSLPRRTGEDLLDAELHEEEALKAELEKLEKVLKALVGGGSGGTRSDERAGHPPYDERERRLPREPHGRVVRRHVQ